MEPATKASGIRTKLMVKVSSFMQMEMYMKDSGFKTKLKVSAYIDT
jgi:hypothetical protein